MTTTRPLSFHQPVARVLPLMQVPQVDRLFDYAVPAELDQSAQPGVRVRIHFHGRRIVGFIYERADEPEFEGDLLPIDSVIAPDIVLPARSRQLVDSLAARYGSTRADIVRLAVPPRHTAAEQADTTTSWDELGEVAEPDLSEWAQYQFGMSFVDAVVGRRGPRAAWQWLPSRDWTEPLAALATKIAKDGGGVLIVAPTSRMVAGIVAALRVHLSAAQVTVLEAQLGPQARYRRYLSVLHGQGRIVVGTRAAAYAPVVDLALAVCLDDIDDNHKDTRQPYPHVRDVLAVRAAAEHAALIVGGYARSAETQQLVESGWMNSLPPATDALSRHLPHVYPAGGGRIPPVAYQRMLDTLSAGGSVLVQVPRTGYAPAIACHQCGSPARCPYCGGPLQLTGHGDTPAYPSCRWCGRPDTHHHCDVCGSSGLRPVIKGTDRTAEELGRAFPGVPVINSSGDDITDTVTSGKKLVIATPGAEPTIEGGFTLVVLLDTWLLLSGSDLRSHEQALASWMNAASRAQAKADVIIAADPSHPVVQALARWDAAGAAARELAARRDVNFPPAVVFVAIDGSSRTVHSFVHSIEFPDGCELLGPVEMPAFERLPADYDIARSGRPQRILVRCPLSQRSQLTEHLHAAIGARIARRETEPLRVQVDPRHIG